MRRLLPWHESDEGGPLGRHVNHDPRNRNFATTRGSNARTFVRHKRHAAVFDQGRYWDPDRKEFISLGSCTGNAVVGCLATEPNYRPGDRWGERKAVRVYSHATLIDPFPGAWPPDDTGCDGTSVCQAALEFGWITRYEHAFSLDAALDALQERPIMAGTVWRTGADRPNADGLIRPLEGDVRGGHEYEVAAYLPDPDPLSSLLECWQSWGRGFGKHGRFYITARDFGTLLEDDGDVTVPVR